ncbi:TlpA disulfide reductase family protein [Prosthecobacter vanneervenii]|uniref:Thiol-disulfide isomerase/thioredoxin n=1 Tax=Prosthecobacter vanneervenii TaxID=48466 RepID=A0A7W7YCI9_9BACT|nr:TlpA disulfide reductase family protein [Prosthecobacter vanneervenii]MBB5033706.1 thiol-disulfide isomerase/thioredoxin [Prosthecobacter vanneervenii]
MKANLLVLGLLFSGLFLMQNLFATATNNNVGTVVKVDGLKFKEKAPSFAGKPLIVEFWATWCPPCRASIPHLNEVYKKYQSKGLEIIGVTNEDRPTVSKFLKEVPINYHVAFDTSGKFGKPFGIKGIPHAMILDKEGKVVWEGHPMSLPESQLESVLK